jgi:O-antigen ligase
MPPVVALTLSLAFTAGLYWFDRRRNPTMSWALWLPTMWLMILSSRATSLWLSLGSGGMDYASDVTEGSPLDRAIYMGMMATGVVVLIRRKIAWGDFFRRNIWLAVFFAYCGLSIVWSDFPGVAFKRWIKSFGDIIMVLIILSDRHPWKALETTFKRVAFMLLPMSVVFIKYYGEWGRGYDAWTGQAFYTGVTTNKNMLGYMLFVFGLFFCGTLLSSIGRSQIRPRLDVAIALFFTFIVGWLFRMSDSKTPLLCLIVSLIIFVASGRPLARKYWASLVTVSLVVFTFLQLAFNITEVVITGAGRNITLTGRTDLWASVLELSTNPILGAGYASFWLGDRLATLWDLYFFRPTQAHNGYLEIYLNLGILGVICLLGILFSSYRSVRARWERYTTDSVEDTRTRDWSRYAMAYMVGLLLYNITESTFVALNSLYIVLLMVVVDFSLERSAAPRAVGALAPDVAKVASPPRRPSVRRYVIPGNSQVARKFVRRRATV